MEDFGTGPYQLRNFVPKLIPELNRFTKVSCATVLPFKRPRAPPGFAMSCLFGKIIEGTIPSTPVYQDELGYAFADINPKAPVHVLHRAAGTHRFKSPRLVRQETRPARRPAVGGRGDCTSKNLGVGYPLS